MHFQSLMQPVASKTALYSKCCSWDEWMAKVLFYTKLPSWHCLLSHCWKYGLLPRYCTQMGPVKVPVNYILMNWCELCLVLVQYLAWVWRRKTTIRAPRITQASPLGCPAVEMSILLLFGYEIFLSLSSTKTSHQGLKVQKNIDGKRLCWKRTILAEYDKLILEQMGNRTLICTIIITEILRVKFVYLKLEIFGKSPQYSFPLAKICHIFY